MLLSMPCRPNKMLKGRSCVRFLQVHFTPYCGRPTKQPVSRKAAKSAKIAKKRTVGFLLLVLEGQHSVSRGGITHEAACVGSEGTLLIQRISQPTAVRLFLILHQPSQALF